MRASVACSNGFDFAGKDGRHRGLFPIPMPSGVSFPVDGGRCSRSVVRRLQSRSHSDRDAGHCLDREHYVLWG